MGVGKVLKEELAGYDSRRDDLGGENTIKTKQPRRMGQGTCPKV